MLHSHWYLLPLGTSPWHLYPSSFAVLNTLRKQGKLGRQAFDIQITLEYLSQLGSYLDVLLSFLVSRWLK